MRCASKQYINNYQIHSWTINAVLMTIEAKESINLICFSPNLFFDKKDFEK